MNNQSKPKGFEEPKLSVIYKVVGCLLMIAGSLLFGGFLFEANPDGWITGLVIAIIIWVTGLIAFGLAEVVTAICETAFNTRK